MEDAKLLAFVRRPVEALILTFPTTPLYGVDKRTEGDLLNATPRPDLPPDVLWFRQTINNACGVYALLDAVCSSGARHS